MGLRSIRRWPLVLAAMIATAALVNVPAPAASAASCPDAQLVFARGRMEPPGPGQIGNALISALRSRVPNRNIGLYAVNYAANTDVQQGANDMSGHVQYMANNCPDTRLVLGGYSLGAAVTDVVLAAPGPMFGFDNPLPPGMDEHVAAVALFGNGSQWVGPITNFNPIYNDRTIELCHGDDPICNPADPKTWQNNWPQHLAPAYIQAGMVGQAADFVAGKL
ncbi:cutinase family protein [Mycobacterium celatum]|uniref:Cutinase n=1 Tax=Mycobacterium celatum TaxID=28045 RepID=A0A1X1RSJ7_MYCCE|nr:cutinase [Mycobacterium celatum]PIB79977.1 cutinase family protein [Mycobacterium celatum]